MTTLIIFGAVLALAATILSFVFIVPNKRKLNAFFQFLHNLFNFKQLYLEKILRFLYVLSTLFCVIGGFLMLFYFEQVPHYDYWYGTYTYTTQWLGYYGLIMMVVGPVAVRISYECIMMAVLAVRNIMEINQKVEKITDKAEADPYAVNYDEFLYQDNNNTNA